MKLKNLQKVKEINQELDSTIGYKSFVLKNKKFRLAIYINGSYMSGTFTDVDDEFSIELIRILDKKITRLKENLTALGVELC